MEKNFSIPVAGTTKTFKEEVIETNYPTQGSTITFKEEIAYDPKREI